MSECPKYVKPMARLVVGIMVAVVLFVAIGSC